MGVGGVLKMTEGRMRRTRWESVVKVFWHIFKETLAQLPGAAERGDPAGHSVSCLLPDWLKASSAGEEGRDVE